MIRFKLNEDKKKSFLNQKEQAMDTNIQKFQRKSREQFCTFLITDDASFIFRKVCSFRVKKLNFLSAISHGCSLLSLCLSLCYTLLFYSSLIFYFLLHYFDANFAIRIFLFVCLFLAQQPPQWTKASSFTRFLDHT